MTKENINISPVQKPNKSLQNFSGNLLIHRENFHGPQFQVETEAEEAQGAGQVIFILKRKRILLESMQPARLCTKALDFFSFRYFHEKKNIYIYISI